jgi:hypothetical protein
MHFKNETDYLNLIISKSSKKKLVVSKQQNNPVTPNPWDKF